MKNTLKKVLSIFVTAVLILSMAANLTISVGATSRSVSDALSWCEAQVGKSLDYDNSYGAQCVDFIYYYYQYLGVSPVGGNAYEYQYNALPAGWQRLQGATPQPGDILIYANHVGVYASPSLMYHQAPSMGGYVMHDAHNYTYYTGYWGVIRPNFSASSSSVSVITLQNISYPINVQQGQPFAIGGGSVSSPNPIVYVCAGVFKDVACTQYATGADNWISATYFSFNEFENAARFSSLSAGTYYMIYKAIDNKGYVAEFSCKFTVSSAATSGATVTVKGQHDHSSYWNAGVVTKSPTCTATGTKTYTCSVCGQTKAETIAATGHKYLNEWTVDTTPTCTTAGSKSHHCTQCDSVTDATPIAMLGHTYDNDRDADCNVCGAIREVHTHTYGAWTTVTAATCTNDGIEQRSCACGAVERRSILKLGHNYAAEWTVDKAPTCTVAGSKSHHCTRCDSIADATPIATVAHTYDNDRDADCNVCGTIREVKKPVAETDPQIIVESKKARAGKTVEVTVSMLNNPGIWGMDLVVNYDRSQLTLTGVSNGSVFSASEWTQGNLSGDKYILSYEASGYDNIAANGVLATLEFTVNENAAAGSFYDISLSYKTGDIINVAFDDIDMATVSGGIDVINFIYGDLNGDGAVNKKDSLLMKMYLADNSTVIDLQAADVYADGSVNKKDSLCLKQYLAGLDVKLGA